MMREAWPPGSRRIFRYGVLLWVMFFQLLALLPDLYAPQHWWIWHLLAFIPGFTIGRSMTMRILMKAIQDRKNRV